MKKLSPTETFKDKKIFFIGGTGFVGKVALSMLLHNFPDVGKVYMIVRARNQDETLNRFWNSVVTSPLPSVRNTVMGSRISSGKSSNLSTETFLPISSEWKKLRRRR